MDFVYELAKKEGKKKKVLEYWRVGVRDMVYLKTPIHQHTNTF